MWEVIESRILANGELLELQRKADREWRVMWIELRSGQKANILDYRNYSHENAARNMYSTRK